MEVNAPSLSLVVGTLIIMEFVAVNVTTQLACFDLQCLLGGHASSSDHVNVIIRSPRELVSPVVECIRV